MQVGKILKTVQYNPNSETSFQIGISDLDFIFRVIKKSGKFKIISESFLPHFSIYTDLPIELNHAT